ncbi:MAG: acylneuraminate cytidylyltransferase family protein [Planctomycetota bacterium]
MADPAHPDPSKDTPAIAIILARAGSKGVPGKNRRPIAGRPCVAWTIDAAHASEAVGRVGVSTDDDEVAATALEMNAEHWPRTPALATHDARIDAAAADALDRAAERKPVDPHALVVLLYANVPVRPPGLIDRAVAVLRTTGCDSVQSYARVGKHHPWWTATLGDGGVVRPWHGEQLFNGVYRRQDLPPACVPDGGVIVLRQSALCAGAAQADRPHAFLGSDHRGVQTEHGDVVDIDTEADLAVAEHLLHTRAAAT